MGNIIPKLHPSIHSASSKVVEKASQKVSAISSREEVKNVVQLYEALFGLDEVKKAQLEVVQSQKEFADIQIERRLSQKSLFDCHKRLKFISIELEKVSKTDSKYLDLITKEHTILQEEEEIKDKCLLLENEEKQAFDNLSHRLRESHEKEKSRVEKTRYWGILLSMVTASLGIIGTTINNRLRNRELRNLMLQASSGSHDKPEEMESIVRELKIILDEFKQGVVSDIRVQEQSTARKGTPAENIYNDQLNNVMMSFSKAGRDDLKGLENKLVKTLQTSVDALKRDISLEIKSSLRASNKQPVAEPNQYLGYCVLLAIPLAILYFFR